MEKREARVWESAMIVQIILGTLFLLCWEQSVQFSASGWLWPVMKVNLVLLIGHLCASELEMCTAWCGASTGLLLWPELEILPPALLGPIGQLAPRVFLKTGLCGAAKLIQHLNAIKKKKRFLVFVYTKLAAVSLLNQRKLRFVCVSSICPLASSL